MVLLPSVTSKRTCMFSPRTTLPSLTRPPRRMRVPAMICFSATSVGELKNTIESLSATRMRATAIATTPSAEPIRMRRLCLRVIASFLRAILVPWSDACHARSRFTFPGHALAFEAKSFHEIVNAAQLVRLRGERTARVRDRCQGLLALAEHHIGAHQPQPSLEVRSVAIEAFREPRNHGTGHGRALLSREIGGRGYVLLARARAAARKPRDFATDELGPGRVGGSVCQNRAPDFDGGIRPALLLSGNAEEK